MSAFGWNERISELEKGKFNCPNCRRDAGFVLIESRKWFHFLFVPALPESRPLRFVRCDRCKFNFDESVLGHRGERRPARGRRR